MIIAEAAYMIHRQVGLAGELALYDSIIDGTLTIGSLTPADWQRVVNSSTATKPPPPHGPHDRRI
jgi:hypothetical protein